MREAIRFQGGRPCRSIGLGKAVGFGLGELGVVRGVVNARPPVQASQ